MLSSSLSWRSCQNGTVLQLLNQRGRVRVGASAGYRVISAKRNPGCASCFEYTLLPTLLRDALPAGVCRLMLLVVEWHERMMPAHRGESARLRRLLQRPECNVTVVDWD